MPDKEPGTSLISENWYFFLKTKTQKQLKEQRNWRQNKPKNAAKKRWWKAQKGWERNTTKLNEATVLGKVLRDQMAKGVIYPFAYFCNTECSKIIYGFGINTEAVGSISLSLPPSLPHPCTTTPWLQLRAVESSHITHGLVCLPPAVSIPKRAVEQRGSCSSLRVRYSACCEQGGPEPSYSLWAEMGSSKQTQAVRTPSTVFVQDWLEGGLLTLRHCMYKWICPRGSTASWCGSLTACVHFCHILAVNLGQVFNF